MRIIQLKSTCCSAKVRRFGDRRRQCAECKRTWRTKTRQLGRNARRNNNDDQLLETYLAKTTSSLSGLSRLKYYPEPPALATRMRQARNRYLLKPWPQLPTGQLILIADGLQYQHKYQHRTMYLMLVRSLDSTQAVILPPVVVAGKESQFGWQQALSSLDSTTSQRITAMVCDGHRGLVNAAKRNSWVLQRCHFHLKKGLNNYLRTGSRSTHQPLAGEVHALVDILLTSIDDRRIYEQVVPQLQWCARTAPSAGSRKVLTGLVNWYQDYRSYIYQAELRLPRTSNAAESTVNIVRSLEKQAHGWSTPASFEAWATAVLKHKATIACHESQPDIC